MHRGIYIYIYIVGSLLLFIHSFFVLVFRYWCAQVERLLEGDGACGAGGTGTRGLGSVEHVLAVVRAIISDAAPTVVSTVPSAGGADAAPAVVADGERKEGKGIASTHNNLISQSTISLGDLQRFHQGIPPLPLQLSVEEVQAANSLDHLVMVFLNTAEDAQRFADAILNLGVQCAQFHGLLRGAERAESLRLFREGAVRILVCTDSAARGLDLPMVRHVLQADFALNVVQHQHRVGRASRAGRAGRATNFYWGDRANALVESILGMTTVPRKKQLQEQQTVEKIRSLQQGKGEWEKSVEGTVGSTEEVFVLNSMPTLPDDEPEEIRSPQSIDQSFSRRRGFRRNMKRLGKKATETSMQPNY